MDSDFELSSSPPPPPPNGKKRRRHASDTAPHTRSSEGDALIVLKLKRDANNATSNASIAVAKFSAKQAREAMLMSRSDQSKILDLRRLLIATGATRRLQVNDEPY